MFIELHMIQNFAPANLNRDDTGAPKDCEFGGHRRARISSQCLKRSIRLNPAFETATGVSHTQRTRWLSRLLAPKLEAAGKSEEDSTLVASALAKAYADGANKQNPQRTDVLLFLSKEEQAYLLEEALGQWDSLLEEDEKTRDAACNVIVKSLIKAQKGRTSAPDIALFGRMLASRPDLGLEAACQVAHAISTHRVDMEMDYFTAVDDVLEDEVEVGAGMIGTTGYNSSCFYRYARVDWDQLVKNLNGDTDLASKALEGFFRAAVVAVPSGKQNAFAANNPPAFLLAVVREDGMGWSLANAFEKPVHPSRDQSLSQASVTVLDDYWGKLTRAYGESTLKTVAAQQLDDYELPNLSDKLQPSLDAWADAVLAAVTSAQEAV